MRHALTLAALLLATPLGAVAQTYDYPSYPTYRPAYEPPPVPRYVPPVTYQHYGDMTFGSDGSSSTRYGSDTFIAVPGAGIHVCSQYGSQTICN
jgi:hypothetical protein